MAAPIHYMIKFMLIAVFVAVFTFIVTGKFLDLKVERTNVDMTRMTANFINYLSSSSLLLVNDSGGHLLKAYIDERKLSDLDNNEWNQKGCCSLNNFNYIYSVSELGKKPLKNFSDAALGNEDPGKRFPYFNPKSVCYEIGGFLRMSSIDSIVNICSSQFDCRLGKEELTMTKTPLSEITYWLSRACTTKDQNFRKTILIDPNDVSEIRIDSEETGGKVCVRLKDGVFACKRYECSGSNIITESGDIPGIEDLEEKSYGLNARCFGVAVRAERGFVYFDNPLELTESEGR